MDEAVRTTFVSRVGGGHEVRTLEEQEEEDITIKVTHPDTTRAHERERLMLADWPRAARV